jgi:hypothetical protein
MEEGFKWKFLAHFNLSTKTVSLFESSTYGPLQVLLPRSPLTKGISDLSKKEDPSQQMEILGKPVNTLFFCTILL